MGKNTIKRNVSVIDIESFIYEVRERPCIWDNSSNDYTNKNKRCENWNEICQIYELDFDSMTEEKRRQIGHSLQKKWKNLRLSFVRDVIRQRRTKKPPNHPYYDELSFLLPVLSDKNFREDFKIKKEIVQVESGSEEETGKLRKYRKRQRTSINDSTASICSARNESRINNPSQCAMFESAIETHIPSQNPTEIDEDRCFLLSLLSSLKEVPLHLRMQMRMDVMQAIMKHIPPASSSCEEGYQLPTEQSPP